MELRLKETPTESREKTLQDGNTIISLFISPYLCLYFWFWRYL